MATRFYLRNTSDSTTGLPTTKQSTQTTVTTTTATTVNKQMLSTIGTTQTSIGSTPSSTGINYYGRWVSDILSSSTIAANTWTFRWGFSDSGIADTTLSLAVYVWRPSTTTKIGTIFDSTIGFTNPSNTGEVGYVSTFSGSAVSSISLNDVICLEWMVNTQNFTTHTIYYDGTNSTFANQTTGLTSAATYLETPENITIGAPPGVTATVTGKTNTNKFINKV